MRQESVVSSQELGDWLSGLGKWPLTNGILWALKFFILCYLMNALYANAQPRKIWIDTDILMGKPWKDVDDGLAIMLALNSDEVRIQGISLVNNVDYGYKVTERLLGWYGTDQTIRIYKGAKNLEPPGADNDAIKAIAESLNEERMTILALGPATNIAALLRYHPGVISQIEEIVFCMGRRPGYHFNPGKGKKNLSDYNFDLDPESMAYVLEQDVKITLSCYEAASYYHLGMDDIEPLKSTGYPGHKWVYKQLKSWARMWRIFLGAKEGFIPFDTAPMGHVIAPEYFKYDREIPVKIEVLENDTRRQNKNREKPYLLVSHDFDSKRKVDYCHETIPGFKTFLLDRLQSFDKNK